MALTISQVVAAGYPAVVARKAQNQWAESAFMRELERQGAIVKRDLGPTIEVPLDYRRNPGGDFLATDLTPTSLSKTEVLTSASYSVAELTVPIVWSKGDEAKNPSDNQKISLGTARMENAVTTHDDLIEEALFTTSTDGFLGLATHAGSAGTETDGGIDANVETFWRSKIDSFQSDGSDIEAVMTSMYNVLSKGSGSQLTPKIIVSGSATQVLFESSQQALQRYADGEELKAGFKVLSFKAARYVFSQYGGTTAYFLNPKSFQVIVSKDYFREKGESNEIDTANGFVSKIYSALQSVTGNRSRLGQIAQA